MDGEVEVHIEEPVIKRVMPGMAISVEALIPDIAHIKLESLVGRDDTLAEQNAVLDRMNRLILRQKAVHGLQGLKDDLEKAIRERDVAFQNMADARTQAAEDIETLEQRLKTASAEYDKAYAGFASDWRGRGKQTPFTPASHPTAKSTLEQMTAGQITLEDQIKTKRQELERNEEVHKRNVPIFKAAIAVREGRIADAEARIAQTDE
jgi:hypothetical protein